MVTKEGGGKNVWNCAYVIYEWPHSARGQCVPRGSTCPKSCNEVQKANHCPEMKCAMASDCEKCKKISLTTGKVQFF